MADTRARADDYRTVKPQRPMRSRIAGRFATAGLGLTLGNLLVAGFMLYQWMTADIVIGGAKSGPVIWGLGGFQVAMHSMLLPPAMCIVGASVPLGRLRSALGRVVWAVVLVVVGGITFAVSWLWTLFVMYCWFMACPG